MANYTLPPRSKASDYIKGKLTQDEIIALQVANDANISSARKAVKMGEVPQLTPIQTLSPTELLADDASQEASARSNLERLGFRPQEAAEVITGIRRDANLSFASFNSNFPAIEVDIKARFNVKLLTPAFFVEYLRQYTQELLASRGLNVGNSSRSINALINSVAEIRQVLPSQDQMRELRFRVIAASRNTVNRNLLTPILERIDILGNALPNQLDYGRIQNLNIAETQRIIQRINTITTDLPTREQVDNLIRQVDRGDREIMTNLTALADSVPNDFKRKMDNVLKDVREVASLQDQTLEEVRRIQNLSKEKEGNWEGKLILTKTDWNKLDKMGKRAFLRSRFFAGDLFKYAKKLGAFEKPLPDLDVEWDGWIELNANKFMEKESPYTTASMSSYTTGETDSYSNPYSMMSGATPTGISDLMAYSTLKRSISGDKKKGNGLKVGRGIAVKQTPSYKEYGKYAIHIPQLEQQDLLNVKYKSLGQIPKFKPIPVSDIFRDFILDLLENGKPNGRVYTQIAPEERKYFEEMSIGAGVWNSLGLKRTTTSTDEEENKRFELLRGEYLAGNNNTKVISELRKLVVKMMSDGRIRKTQGVELLMELSL
jgi:hypothetical protein